VALPCDCCDAAGAGVSSANRTIPAAFTVSF
jgi:hypothetical protein